MLLFSFVHFPLLFISLRSHVVGRVFYFHLHPPPTIHTLRAYPPFYFSHPNHTHLHNPYTIHLLQFFDFFSRTISPVSSFYLLNFFPSFFSVCAFFASLSRIAQKISPSAMDFALSADYRASISYCCSQSSNKNNHDHNNNTIIIDAAAAVVVAL